ncbi:MAG: DUF2959 family protein [Candidatus Hydrogenedentes bacterium]|nr:DUF2959 family protein [Candidatus Hydrogenedentota bacterium]
MKQSIPMLTLAALMLNCGCQSAYYATMEKVGYHKRDILVNRVEDARDAQEDTAEQFQTALERFTSVVQFEGGALEDKYNTLQGELNRSESHAEEVHGRVAAVEDVAEALFDEWASELDEYTNASLRTQSKRQLDETRRRYEQLIRAMRRAKDKIEPVLSTFRDQVLFLKHNLNAQAIASLENELAAIETDVADLIREMERAISEADAFIREMKA